MITSSPGPSTAPEPVGLRCPSCDEPVRDDDRFCEACGARRPDPRDRVELTGSGVAAVSDRGRRHRHNEDAVAIRSLGVVGRGAVRVAVVCDGVSRGARPDLASQAAVDAALTVFARTVDASTGASGTEDATRRAVRAAGASVARLSGRADVDMPPACTFASVVLVGHRATVASVGDSRVYWLPRERPGARALTVDDSWHREVLAAGTMSEAAAAADRRRHAITAWLGADADPDALVPHLSTEDLDAPGVLLVCTDGLWNSMDGPADLADLAEPAHRPSADLLGVTRRLVGTALDRDGRDNVTAAVLTVRGEPSPGLDEPEETP